MCVDETHTHTHLVLRQRSEWDGAAASYPSRQPDTGPSRTLLLATCVWMDHKDTRSIRDGPQGHSIDQGWTTRTLDRSGTDHKDTHSIRDGPQGHSITHTCTQTDLPANENGCNTDLDCFS